jgi:hypothetical protein
VFSVRKTFSQQTRAESRLTVQRTPHAEPRFRHDVRVDLRRLDAFVSEQFLNGADVRAAFEEVRGKRRSAERAEMVSPRFASRAGPGAERRGDRRSQWRGTCGTTAERKAACQPGNENGARSRSHERKKSAISSSKAFARAKRNLRRYLNFDMTRLDFKIQPLADLRSTAAMPSSAQPRPAKAALSWSQ